MKNLKIAVLYGGCSSEHDISIESAKSVIANMGSGYTPIPIEITRDGDWFRQKDGAPAFLSPSRSGHILITSHNNIIEKTNIDAVFPVLHGKNGEDGTIQGLCEMAGIPLVGCGTLSSALCMDKEKANRLVQTAGVKIPRSFLWEGKTDYEKARKIGYPLFVKPVRSGSSLGISKVSDAGDLADAFQTALRYDDNVICQEAVPGFEVGCAVMGNSELITGEVDEIELTGGFFDFTEKYQLVSSQIHVPARISDQKAEEIKRTAKIIYRTLGCRGFARVDMFLTPEGELLFNEVNTIPGFTTHSRFPAMMEAAGMSLEQVISYAIRLAVEQ